MMKLILKAVEIGIVAWTFHFSLCDLSDVFQEICRNFQSKYDYCTTYKISNKTIIITVHIPMHRLVCIGTMHST